MQQRMMALESAYEKLRQALNKITGEPSQDLINETVECCLRPIEGVKNRYLVGRMYSNQRDCQVLSEASRGSQKQVYRERVYSNDRDCQVLSESNREVQKQV